MIYPDTALPIISTYSIFLSKDPGALIFLKSGGIYEDKIFTKKIAKGWKF